MDEGFYLHSVKFSIRIIKGRIVEVTNATGIPKAMTIKEDVNGPMKQPISHMVKYRELARFKFV